jgi:hypothetical protein
MDEINRNGSISRVAGKPTVIYLVIGWIAAVASLVRFPFVFGLVGVIMGIIANKNGSRAAMPLIIGSILLMAVGLIFSGVFYNYLRHALGMV